MKLRCSPYNPLLFFGLLGTFCFFSLSSATAQCQLEVQYSVQKNGNSYSLFLDSQTPTGSVKVQLYDLYQGKIIAEREISSLTIDPREVFRDIAPSKYALFVSAEGCDQPKTLGGLNGISIGIQD
jgi:hypothetical protein